MAGLGRPVRHILGGAALVAPLFLPRSERPVLLLGTALSAAALAWGRRLPAALLAGLLAGIAGGLLGFWGDLGLRFSVAAVGMGLLAGFLTGFWRVVGFGPAVDGADLLILYLLWNGIGLMTGAALQAGLSSPPGWLPALSLFLSPLLLGILTFGLLSRRLLLREFLVRNYNRRNLGRQVVWGTAAGFAFLSGSALLVSWLARFIRVRPNNPFLVHPRLLHLPQGIALILVGAVLLAPIAEEAFFRGLLYPLLKRRFGVGWGMVLSGLLFGAAHLDPSLLLPLSLGGILLAYVYEETGSLIASGIGHAFLNLVVTVVTLTRP